MSETSVVQLARFNSTDYASNTEWRTTLQNSIVLNQGDTAVISKAYLDSRLNAGGNIVIEADVDLSLTYYFYQMFSPDGTSNCAYEGTPPVDQPGTTGIIVPDSDPPTVATVTTLNPSDLEMWYSVINQGPVYDASGDLQNGSWATYQRGTLTTDGNAGPNPQYWDGILNDGIPTAPWWDKAEVFSGTQKNNQCYAGEIPLLLTSIPRDVSGVELIDTSVPYTKVWNYTLKAGTYAPAQLAEILTRAMSQIQPDGDERQNYTAYNQFGTSQNIPKNNAFLAKGQCVSLINLLTQGVGVPFKPLVPYLMLPPPDWNDTAWLNGMTYATNDTLNPLYPQNNYILSTFLLDGVIPPKYLKPPYPTLTTPNNPLIFQNTKFSSGYAVNINDSLRATMNYETPLIGCSEPELVWNDQAGVFQFVYTHTPLQELPTGGGAAGTNTGSNPIEVVKIIKTINVDFANPAPPGQPFLNGEVNICEHTKHSGIIFQKMEPVEFWQGILGFDVPNITIAPQDLYGSNRSLDFKKFKQITTSGFVGIQNNFNYRNLSTAIDPTIGNLNCPPYLGPAPIYPGGTLKGPLTYNNLLNSGRWFSEHYLLQNPAVITPGITIQQFPWYDFFPFFYEEYSSALAATNPISAISPPLSNSGNVGHYLIEIVAYGKDQEMITNQTVYQIKSIVSSYYQSAGSFQSQPFPDAYTYEHVGETQVIYSFKVRIIDPYTMDTAKNLGPSSSVYIQFNRALNKISLSQPDQ